MGAWEQGRRAGGDGGGGKEETCPSQLVRDRWTAWTKKHTPEGQEKMSCVLHALGHNRNKNPIK